LVAAALVLLAGCSSRAVFAEYPTPESPTAASAPWPRLVDGPTHFAPLDPGPDPAQGAVVATTLTEAARAQAATAERLAPPVAPVEELRREAEAARAGR
jgi:hypothetical protein